MRLKNLDLILAVSIAAVNMVWVLLPSRIPGIGIILALPLVLVLPGYTLTEILFPERSFDASHRLILSLGLSLAIDILGGLILNLLPVGLQALSWAVLLGLLTAVFSLPTVYFRRGVGTNKTQLPRFRFTIYECLLFGLAITVAVLSVLYSVIGATQQRYPGFTQLSMLPSTQFGKSCAVRLGIHSFESTSVTFRVTMTMNSVQTTSWPSFVLKSQEQWDRLVQIVPEITETAYVEVQLYRLDEPQTVYRQVNLTLHNCLTSQIIPTPYPSLASTYNGTIYDVSANLPATMFLTGMQESKGNINGYFRLSTGLQGSGPFRGIVTHTQQIRFTVTDDTRHTILSFDGKIQSLGIISGSYCTLDQERRCKSDYGYGLWSVTPISS